MLSKCLNPQCTAKFRYLGEGRLFRIDFAEIKRRKSGLSAQRAHNGPLGDPGSPRQLPRQLKDGLDQAPAVPPGPVPVLCLDEKERPVEHFWLCGGCAASMTLDLNDAGEIHLIKLPPPPEAATVEPPGPKLVAAS
jgi:hypothetical protein